MKGLELSKRYYLECIKPIIESEISAISKNYAAGLIGSGSDILGNDDDFSRDHEWGPRCYLFINNDDHDRFALSIENNLNRKLPSDFLGFPTHFDIGDLGHIPSKNTCEGHCHICITTPTRFIELTLGIKKPPVSDFQWLLLSEQRLLEFTAGEIFDDFNGELSNLRHTFSYFPENVWKYKLAFCLESLGWEDDLIFLCGARNDLISMHLNASKTVEKLMRLTFLLNKKYAPLSPKWLQREFRKLPKIAPQIEGELLRVLEAKDYREKSDALNFIYEIMLSHLESEDLCNIYPRKIRPNVSGVRFDIQRSAKDVLEKISGEIARKTISGNPIGAVDQWMTNEDIILSAEHMNSFSPVYNPKRTEKNKLGDLFIA